MVPDVAAIVQSFAPVELFAALVLSGDTAPAELLRVRDAGLHMLHKPLGVDALYAAVNDELRQIASSEAAGA